MNMYTCDESVARNIAPGSFVVSEKKLRDRLVSKGGVAQPHPTETCRASRDRLGTSSLLGQYLTHHTT